MAESLHEAAEYFGKHKVIIGVVGAAILLWLLLRSGSGSTSASGSGGNFAQIAQLQAAQNIQMAQLQAQQNTASLGAQVQQNQNNEALQAEQDQLAAQVAGTAFQFKAQEDTTTAQASLYKDLIDTGAKEQLAQLSTESTLASQIIPKLDSQHYKDVNLNALALVTGQGNVGSYNQSTASESIASTLEQGSILKSIFGGASSAVGTLSAGLF